MSRLITTFLALASIMACLPAYSENIPALPPPMTPAGTNSLMPPMPKASSPVAFFRQLLAMSTLERNQALTNRSPESRARIMTKVREYLVMSPDERELRLRATELRWYLTPLLRQTPEQRTNSLTRVPEDLRGPLEARLKQWDILPPPMQAQLLDNEKTLQYFSQVQTNNPGNLNAEQQRLSEQFNQFFELTPMEKEQTLGTLSDAEREAMERTLKTFDNLPPQQRMLCIRNYAKFAGMSPAERSAFLKNAEQWSKMSPDERQTWRNLVAQIPQMPPMPPPVIPANLFPHPIVKPRPSVVTN